MLVENEIEIDEARKGKKIVKLHNVVMTPYNEVHLASKQIIRYYSQSIKRYSSIKTVFKTARKAHFDNQIKFHRD